MICVDTCNTIPRAIVAVGGPALKLKKIIVVVEKLFVVGWRCESDERKRNEINK